MAKAVLATLDFSGGGGKVTGLPTPTLASDAVPKSYADSKPSLGLTVAVRQNVFFN